MSTIFWAGDSTVQFNGILTFPQTGIGQVLSMYLKPEIRVENHAKNGRSTKSFIDQSRLAPIYDRIGEGDFLFIQFGHNDEKEADAERYTDPDTEYRTNLGKFINVARNKKAYPVLITPLERRMFDEDGHLMQSGHLPYVQAMKKTAKELSVPLIDLFTMSREKIEKVLISLGEKELRDMVEEGKEVEVNCSFCSRHYSFSVDELERLYRRSR